MNTAAWEALLACKYAAPDIPATMGQATHSGSELDLMFSLGCMRFHRRAPLRPSLSVLYTYIPLRIMPIHKGVFVNRGSRDAHNYGTLVAQLLRMAASTVGEFSAQTVVIDLEGLREYEKAGEAKKNAEEMSSKHEEDEESSSNKCEESLAEQICPHIYETIRSMHATLAPNWRKNAHKLSTVYILGTGSRGMRIYTTTVVHEEDSVHFLLKHRMFSTSAESQTGALLYDVIKTAQTIPCTPNWDNCDVDPRIIKGALLRMVSSVEDAVVGDARDTAANRAAVRTAVKSIVLEQSLKNDFGFGQQRNRLQQRFFNSEQDEAKGDKDTQSHNNTESDKQISEFLEDDKPTLDTLLLSRLLIEPNYIPKLAILGSVDIGRDIVSLRQILGAFAIAARAPPSTPLFETEGDFVYRGRDTLGVLSSVARMAIVLLASGVEAPLCAAYLATPLSIIREIENRERVLPTPKAIGTVGIASSGIISGEKEGAGIDKRPDGEGEEEREAVEERQ